MFESNEINTMLAKRIGLEDLDECSYFPKYIQIATINACNSNCIMCPAHKVKRKTVTMHDSLYQKMVDEMKNYVDWISMVYLNEDNEPTLDKSLPDRIKMLKDVGIKHVSFSTNVQRLTPKLSSDVVNAGLDDIMLSLDAYTEETYSKIRKGLNFKTVLRNAHDLIRIRDAMNSDMIIRLRMVIINENKEEVDDFLKYWASKVRSTDRVYAQPEHSWGNQTYKEEPDKIEYYSNKPCVYPFSTMSVHSDGTVIICGVDYSSQYIMGNLWNQSMHDIWNGQPFTRIRQLHANKKRNEITLCQGCNLWDRDSDYRLATVGNEG